MNTTDNKNTDQKWRIIMAENTMVTIVSSNEGFFTKGLQSGHHILYNENSF